MENLWDLSAETYFQLTPSIPCYTQAAEQIVRQLALREPSTLLDLGCGSTAIVTRTALRLLPDLTSVSCCDSSPEMIRVARTHLHDPRLRFFADGADRLPESLGGSVDALVCNASAWHIGFETLFRSAKRALSDRGCVAFNVFDWDANLGGGGRRELYEAIDRELAARKLPRKPNRGSAEKTTRDDIVNCAARHGFRLTADRAFQVEMSPADYRLFYAIPAIASKSLPHVPTGVALSVLGTATLDLLGTVIEPLRGHEFIFCATVS